VDKPAEEGVLDQVLVDHPDDGGAGSGDGGHGKVGSAVAGGIDPQTAPMALKSGADILIVGRYITQSRDIRRATREFLEPLGADMDLFRVHVE
jgi:hypothetical protein